MQGCRYYQSWSRLVDLLDPVFQIAYRLATITIEDTSVLARTIHTALLKTPTTSTYQMGTSYLRRRETRFTSGRLFRWFA